MQHGRTYSGMPLLDDSPLNRADSVATTASETGRDGGHLSSLRATPPPAQQQQTFIDESSDSAEGNDSFKVVVRVRPPLSREMNKTRPFQNTVLLDATRQAVTISEDLTALAKGTSDSGLAFSTYRFKFDYVHDARSEQIEVYDRSAKGVVDNAIQGYNAAIIAYGQTGTGKTHTMEGALEGDRRGIIPRAVQDIFHTIQTDTSPHSRWLVRASYLQIYNEVISDLLKPDKINLVIHEDAKRGVYVHGLSEWVVRSPEEVYTLMQRGGEARMTGATKMNESSSRSHAVFIIIIEQSSAARLADVTPGTGSNAAQASAGGEGKGANVRVGKLNLVDLAGSERVGITGATGKRLEESKKINQSLSALGNVISALTDPKNARSHVPYRDSKLTRILEDSLGGNCKTTLVATISPALEAFGESLSTLKFANRAKNIRNSASVNEDVDQRTLLRKYERELKRLRGELQQRQAQVVDKRHLLAVEAERRQAEADKVAAITALERAAREFMRDKEDKARLEARIASLQSQLLTGGTSLETSPAVRTLLAREQQRIRSEYEQRLKDLERERESAEEDKAQVDKYRLLLSKQRDIMIQLTARLNQRDEQILKLQEELEAYDSHQQQLQDEVDVRTAELIALRKAAVEQVAASPATPRGAALQNALGPWAAGALALDPSAAATLQHGVSLDPQRHRRVTATSDSLTAHRVTLERSNSGSSQQASTPKTRESGDLSGPVRHDSFGSSKEEDDVIRASDGGGKGGGEQMRDKISRLQTLLSGHQDAQAAADARSAELDKLRQQATVSAKERAALKTILDAKMRPLVAGVVDSLMELAPEQAQDHPRILRQMGALEKLVASTVAAMSQ
ncbi:hypothetical protein WJX73_005541 [Symbiochloris irregularis]|uniref:Kinesin-like protein n=1 Tax=Symbiochloris irregularis TaxID=706552 RepID=A0AAW1P7V9_9CHLO